MESVLAFVLFLLFFGAGAWLALRPSAVRPGRGGRAGRRRPRILEGGAGYQGGDGSPGHIVITYWSDHEQ